MISSRARPAGLSEHLLGSLVIDAERDLARLCRPVRAAGFSGGRFIHYPLLVPPQAASPEALPADPWGRLSQAFPRDDTVVERLKGYAGRLVCDPAFLAEAAALESRWRDLPEGTRPVLPLASFICVNDYPALAPTSNPGPKAFEDDFRLFCDRWLLAGMATWDLPVPRGPVFPGSEGGTAEVYPPGMVALAMPFFYPLLGDDALQQEVYARQRAVARRAGLDPALAGLSHHKVYGNLLTVAHLERVILRRYGRGNKCGLVGAVEDALHRALGVSKDQVKKLRKAVSACRRGKEASLRWLRPRRR
jgi:hypothetical protein